MDNAKIIRVETDPNYGTFGVLTLNGEAACLTLEPYSMDNKKNISCIPTGQYICKRYHSKKHPNTFQVTNVASRSSILIHPGNIKKHTNGCILLGSEFGILGNKHGILESSKAFDKFMKFFEGKDEFRLTIVEEF